MRTIERRNQPMERHSGPPNTPSTETAASGSARRMEVETALTSRWRSLDVSIRRSVESLFECAPVTSGVTLAVDGDLPQEFVRDLASGGRAFRDAFPGLVRRVVEISSCEDLVSVRVVCEGDHSGNFFELLTATHRGVRFEVVHHFTLDGAAPREHRIVLDVRRIISQLVAATPRPTALTIVCSANVSRK